MSHPEHSTDFQAWRAARAAALSTRAPESGMALQCAQATEAMVAAREADDDYWSVAESAGVLSALGDRWPQERLHAVACLLHPQPGRVDLAAASAARLCCGVRFAYGDARESELEFLRGLLPASAHPLVELAGTRCLAVETAARCNAFKTKGQRQAEELVAELSDAVGSDRGEVADRAHALAEANASCAAAREALVACKRRCLQRNIVNQFKSKALVKEAQEVSEWSQKQLEIVRDRLGEESAPSSSDSDSDSDSDGAPRSGIAVLQRRRRARPSLADSIAPQFEGALIDAWRKGAVSRVSATAHEIRYDLRDIVAQTQSSAAALTALLAAPTAIITTWRRELETHDAGNDEEDDGGGGEDEDDTVSVLSYTTTGTSSGGSLDALLNRVDDLAPRLAGRLRRHVDRLREQCGAENDDLARARADAESARAAQAEAEARLRAVAEDKVVLGGELAAERLQLQAAERHAGSLMASLAEAKHNASLAASTDGDASAALAAQAAAHQMKVTRLRECVAQLTRERDSALEDARAAAHDVREVSAKALHAAAENGRLEAQLDDAEFRAQSMRREVDELQQHRQEFGDLAAEFESEISTCRDEAAALEASANAAREDSTEAISVAERRIRGAEEAVAAERATHATERSAHAVTRSELAATQNRLNGALARADSLQDRLERTQGEVYEARSASAGHQDALVKQQRAAIAESGEREAEQASLTERLEGALQVAQDAEQRSMRLEEDLEAATARADTERHAHAELVTDLRAEKAAALADATEALAQARESESAAAVLSGELAALHPVIAAQQQKKEEQEQEREREAEATEEKAIQRELFADETSKKAASSPALSELREMFVMQERSMHEMRALLAAQKIVSVGPPLVAAATPTRYQAAEVSGGAGYCRHCGERCEADDKWCSLCGMELLDSSGGL